MKMHSLVILAATVGFGMSTGAQAQSAGNLLGAPLVAGGNLLNGAAAAHAGIAPSVNQASPSVEPLTDGVTNAIAAAGAGASGSGSQVQANGLRVGSTSSGQPIASVGATQPANQGTVAALFNGHR